MAYIGVVLFSFLFIKSIQYRCSFLNENFVLVYTNEEFFYLEITILCIDLLKKRMETGLYPCGL